MTRPGVDLASILAAARKRSPGERGGRSSVYQLMWDDHAHLAPELNPPRRPNWRAVAEVLGRQGLLDGAGQALTAASAETVRKTWWKVNRDKQAVATGEGRRPRAAAPSQAAPAPSAAKGMLPPGVEPAEEEPPRFTFQFARAKDWTKVADQGDE